MNYDIIGDVHGQADALVRLLKKLGYRERHGAWRHRDREAVFVGDLIDRGPRQLDTVTLVRKMVDAGSATAVMGNHEFDAIIWFLPDPARPGEYLRSHFSPRAIDRHRKQHEAFLAEFEDRRLHEEVINWFMTLPLWLEVPGARIVHACWHPDHVSLLRSRLVSRRLDADLIFAGIEQMTPGRTAASGPSVLEAAQVLLRGMAVPLPSQHELTDEEGRVVKSVQLRWWDPKATSYRDAALLPDDIRAQLPGIPLPRNAQIGYADALPVFFGHYWVKGVPKPLSRYAACVDYSAGWGYKLCAYRFDGEPRPRADKFCYVEVMDS